MAEFRIGRLGKKILEFVRDCNGKNGFIAVCDLMVDVYDCREEEPFNDSSDYREIDGDKIDKLTFSQWVSVYNAVRVLEKRGFLVAKMEYCGFVNTGKGGNNTLKKIKLSEKGEEYVSKHLVSNKIITD